jgi:tRNA G18 (ribose-2'-O)-methylase SpoU
VVEAAVARRGPVRLVVLEGLNDPENLGLVARTARAFGTAGLILDPTCIDPYYRRTVRVSMGEVLLLPVARAERWPDVLDLLHGHGFETWALTPRGDVSLWDAVVPERVALLLGAEGPGLTDAAIAAARRRVAIPIDPAVDSINVGHAAAVALAAVAR